jgi:Glucose / Sorbosone dehydrogenase
VLTIEHSAHANHNGGQLQFGPDGYLYASTGDGGGAGDPDGNAQNTASLLGKILRIDPEGTSPGDYTIPAGNPFVGTGGADEIWSYGLRNPWRFSFDRVTGAMTIGDVGQGAWEEIDYDPGPGPGRGDNFGWDCREGMHDFSSDPPCDDPPAFTEPVFEYANVDGSTCAITGGYVVRDQALAGLYGRYLYADFCAGELRSLNPGIPMASDDRSVGLSVPDVSSFGEDADCRIYVASLNGPVYRLTEPAAGGPVGCPQPQPPPPPPSEPLPSNDFSFGRLKKNKKKGIAKLTVKLPGSGELQLAKTKKVKADNEVAEDEGKEKLQVKPKGKAKKALNRKGKAKVKAEVTYTPEGGEPNNESKTVGLKKR